MARKKATVIQPSYWDIKMQRRQEFCTRFVAEHHPEMADAHKIKGAHPLIPLGAPSGWGLNPDWWWFQTNDSMAALGFVYLNHLFQRHRLRDHEWIIGRSDQEPWALISEPYDHGGGKQPLVEALRRAPEPTVAFEVDYQETQIPISRACTLVWNCTDIVPDALFIMVTEGAGLDEVRSRSYAACARAMRAHIKVLVAAYDAVRADNAPAEEALCDHQKPERTPLTVGTWTGSPAR